MPHQNGNRDNQYRWFANPCFDLAFFHLPVWLCWAIVFAIPPSWRQVPVPTWVWVAAVLLIDVGHVWTSIYRTYLDPVARKHHARTLKLTPLICFAVCLALALHSDLLFWRVLAYVAVFHFIKQQVGIAALYRYRQVQGSGNRLPRKTTMFMGRIDKLTVYCGTLFPVIHWHLSPGKKFSWFIPGDFLSLGPLRDAIANQPGGNALLSVLGFSFFAFWIAIPLTWVAFHLWAARRYGFAYPIGKTLWVLGTCINWFLGIVYFDSDLAFTLTNVVAHGVPYYGLIGLYGHRRLMRGGYAIRLPKMVEIPSRARFGWGLLYLGFLAPILMLALTEEYLWNFLLYRDYSGFFEAFWHYPMAAVSDPGWRALWMSVLAMPQVVHYVLDGFIWKFNSRNPDLKRFLLPLHEPEKVGA